MGSAFFFRDYWQPGFPWRCCLTVAVLCLFSLPAAGGEYSTPGPRRGLLARIQGNDVNGFSQTEDFPALDEFRLGVLQPVDGPHDDEDGGPNVNLELLFGRFGPQYENIFLNNFLRPRPHIGGSINTDGNTDQFYWGLTWDVFLTQRIFIEGSFGGAVHDGDDDDDEFGCSVNFRESGSIGYNLSERWNVLVTVDHMSNADLCDENRGLTNVGIRFGRKFR